MIGNQRNSDIIHWSETGYSFTIESVPQFTSKILPLYFRHRNFSSFVRQLNMYGFHKERDTGSVYIYTHPSFIKGHPEKLSEIERKLSDIEIKPMVTPKPEKKYLQLYWKQRIMQEQLASLEKNYKEIAETNQKLLSQISECSQREQKLELMLSMHIQQTSVNAGNLQCFYSNIIRNMNITSENEHLLNPNSMFSQY